MSSLVLSGDTSGTVTVSVPAVAGTNTVTIPAGTGTVMVSGAMPAFSAYLGNNQSVTSGAVTKVTLNAEIFDTNNAFDSTTNYRFIPQIAGYYQVNAVVRISGTALTEAQAIIYKNGSGYCNGGYNVYAAQSTIFCTVSTLVYLNGSTDYLELYCYTVGTSPIFQFVSISNTAAFSGSMVRTA